MWLTTILFIKRNSKISYEPLCEKARHIYDRKMISCFMNYFAKMKFSRDHEFAIGKLFNYLSSSSFSKPRAINLQPIENNYRNLMDTSYIAF